jgi:predicted aspartyl protease
VGNFYTACRVETLDRSRATEVASLLVDTGSAYTWIDEKTLESLGVERNKKDCSFTMANGQAITRSTGYVFIKVSGTETVDEVVFGEPGDLQLLGARSLEGLNLRVDATRQQLVAGGPILAAGGRK